MTSTTLPVAGIPAPVSHPQFISHLDWAILQTLLYADIFQYPLTTEEIHRYLANLRGVLKEVKARLASGGLVPHLLAQQGNQFALAGREAIFDLRTRRAEVARTFWPDAVRYGRLIGNLPFVRMVAVTGALAVDNVEPDADVDYLVITAPDRLWLARALTIAIVRLAAHRGVRLCPNYFLSERALVLDEHNLFTAHEVVQMVPISGLQTYRRLRQLNSWTNDYLPNGGGPPRLMGDGLSLRSTAKKVSEAALRTPLGSSIDRWEMRRKVSRFSSQPSEVREAAFGPDWCKGHFHGHKHRILDAFNERLQCLEASLR